MLETKAHGPATCTLLALVPSIGPNLVPIAAGKEHILTLTAEQPTYPSICECLLHPLNKHWSTTKHLMTRVLFLVVQKPRKVK